ncbi:hypothetical protein BHE74_00031470, partial [Ensete ventricosum]
MMKDQFANYVVQKVLETCDDQQRELILSRIKVHLNALKKYTYGKHIVARVEKLVAAGVSEIFFPAERRIGVQSSGELEFKTQAETSTGERGVGEEPTSSTMKVPTIPIIHALEFHTSAVRVKPRNGAVKEEEEEKKKSRVLQGGRWRTPAGSLAARIRKDLGFLKRGRRLVEFLLTPPKRDRRGRKVDEIVGIAAIAASFPLCAVRRTPSLALLPGSSIYRLITKASDASSGGGGGVVLSTATRYVEEDDTPSQIACEW